MNLEYIDVPIDLFSKLEDGQVVNGLKFHRLASNWLITMPNGFEYRNYAVLADGVRFVPVMTANK